MPEKFIPEFNVPYLLLSFGTGAVREQAREPEYESIRFSSGSHWLDIKYRNMFPAPEIAQNKKKAAVILGGFPVFDGRLTKSDFLAELIGNEKISEEFLNKIDGEFLCVVFDRGKNLLTVFNDRFTSYPFYYYIDKTEGSLHGAINFSCLWEYLKKTGKLKINQDAFFEFLWFQRLFGTKTYASGAEFMPDSSILTFDGSNNGLKKYWRRDYVKNRLSLKEHAGIMAEELRRSIRMKTSDGKRRGHFLSGGMDSRSVLAAFDENPPICFTATVKENRELAKAREIALAKGAEHVALELSPEHYAEILEPSVRTVGGMYNYDHGLFYGFNKAVSQKVDMSFHGHGFDYMFQGMYIPGKNLKIGNKTLYYRTLYTPPDDLTEYFINNASYRIKNADIWSFVRKDKRKRLSEFQRSSIADVLNEGKKLTENVFDLWEYLTFHHISRHYSYPNHASIATFVEQRTASFTNMLFDLYLKLPVEQRFNGKIEKECLKILNPALATIWSANTNLPVTASCLTQTVYQIAGFFKRRVIPEKKHPEGEWAERTWPSREYALRTQKGLKYALKKLCESDVLDVLEFLDTEKIRDGFPRWADGEDVPGISGDFVQAVLTAGTFLKQ